MYVCERDGRELKIVRNAELVEELLDDGKPYKIYYADRWTCPACGMDILVTAQNAVSHHFEEGYPSLSEQVYVRFNTYSGA
jgi:hypothetical protein